MPSPPADDTERRRRRAMELVAAGMPKAEVARHVRRSRMTIHRWCVAWAAARSALGR